MLFKRPRLKKAFKMLKGPPIPIVADGAIATETLGYGRLIPLVILDTSDRPDLEEFIRVHQYSGPGDVVSQWATLEDGSKRIGLVLTFSGPMDLTVILAFNPEEQGGLVDQIITAKGLYLQAGRPGDRLIKNPNAPKVIANIPDTGFSKVWDDMFFRAAVKRARASGFDRRQAKDVARGFIAEWRKFGNFRMGHKPSDVASSRAYGPPEKT
jgi:hypothetical protein